MAPRARTTKPIPTAAEREAVAEVIAELTPAPSPLLCPVDGRLNLPGETCPVCGRAETGRA